MPVRLAKGGRGTVASPGGRNAAGFGTSEMAWPRNGALPERADEVIVAHYGQVDPVDITKTLCGAAGDGSYITFRPYELDDEGNRSRPYMSGHVACQACVTKLI